MLECDEDGRPRVVGEMRGSFGFWEESRGEEKVMLRVKLPPAGGLNARERLDLVLRMSHAPYLLAGEGERVVQASWKFIRCYRVVSLSVEETVLETSGQRDPSPLERLVGFQPYQITMRGGLVYVLDGVSMFGGLTVYDVRDPERIRRVGHYAAPGEDFYALSLTPEGKVLVGGRSLHIVESPGVATSGGAF